MDFTDLETTAHIDAVWLMAILASLVSFFLLGLAKRIARHYLAKISARTKTNLDDDFLVMVDNTKTWFLMAVSMYIGASMLSLSSKAEHIVVSVAVIALFIQSGVWASKVMSATLERYRQRQLQENPAEVTTLNAIGFMSKLLIWTIILLLTLDNLGIDITALITGLGIGGIAVALAVQNILGDLLAALSIVLDKPFAVGDFLIIDDLMGSVEHVGLKTTRIRSLSGEQLIFSNSDLLKSRIRNYGRMFERRVVFNIGVTYQTPRDKLKLIPTILRAAVEEHDKTRFDRAHFKDFGAFSLNFETVYYVLVADYNIYMDIQQAINLRLHERFEQEGIEFAYPTQTLILSRVEAPSSRQANL